MFKITKNKDPKLCSAYRCMNSKADKKKFCHKHHASFQKETNLIGYTYNILRQNAKRRRKTITITLEEFKDFCIETNYLTLKGKTSKSASIDCIDPRKGYIKGNIQIMDLGDNAKKSNNFPF